jgi:hypothetical protein
MSEQLDTHKKLQQFIDVYTATVPILYIQMKGITSLNGIKFPEWIKHIVASQNSITSLAGVTFPHGLYHIQFGFNQLTTLNDAEFPPEMKTIDIMNNNITSLEGVDFLHKLTNLTDLHLKNNQITSLANVKFPPGLVSLDLSHNKITSFKGMQFPLSLLNLKLEGNPIDVRTVSELKNPSPFVIRQIVAAFPETGPHFQRMEEEKEEKIEQLFKMLYALNMKKDGGAKRNRKTCRKMKKRV